MELRFWESVSFVGQKAETSTKAAEGGLHQGGDTTKSKVGTWDFEVIVTC